MGTFGAGPFHSDGALDMLDVLATHPAESRHGLVQTMLSRVRDSPDLLMVEYLPDEVMAAAALVAASLPGGEALSATEGVGAREARAAALPMPAFDLAALALEVLLLVAGPEGLWNKGWTDEQTRAEARRTTEGLVAILRPVARSTH
jgi:hypothetical protein